MGKLDKLKKEMLELKDDLHSEDEGKVKRLIEKMVEFLEFEE